MNDWENLLQEAVEFTATLQKERHIIPHEDIIELEGTLQQIIDQHVEISIDRLNQVYTIAKIKFGCDFEVNAIVSSEMEESSTNGNLTTLPLDIYIQSGDTLKLYQVTLVRHVNDLTSEGEFVSNALNASKLSSIL